MWGEARGEIKEGWIAVAAVVANRTRAQTNQFGLTVEAVCQKPAQFSCWNTNATDPDEIANHNAMVNVGPSDPIFAQCMDLARQYIDGQIADPTGGATYYFNPGKVLPTWAANMTLTATIGNHTFYKP